MKFIKIENVFLSEITKIVLRFYVFIFTLDTKIFITKYIYTEYFYLIQRGLNGK